MRPVLLLALLSAAPETDPRAEAPLLASVDVSVCRAPADAGAWERARTEIQVHPDDAESALGVRE